jgi:hypothetical protein
VAETKDVGGTTPADLKTVYPSGTVVDVQVWPDFEKSSVAGASVWIDQRVLQDASAIPPSPYFGAAHPEVRMKTGIEQVESE